MKKIFGLMLLCAMFLPYSQVIAQQCNLQGVVRYKYNDYVGYKIDVGSEINFISVSNAPFIDIEIWNEYMQLSNEYMNYLDMLKIDGCTQSLARQFSNFTAKKENKLKNELDTKCCEQFIKSSGSSEYVALVDGDGKYSVTLPYGEYYMICKSANRERPLLTELTGRIIVKKITIQSPAKVNSVDFGY